MKPKARKPYTVPRNHASRPAVGRINLHAFAGNAGASFRLPKLARPGAMAPSAVIAPGAS
jgi:hypothetical protein